MQRQSTQILAATVVALQAARAMQLDARIDDYDYAWNQLAMDLSWPEDHCCRVYRNMEFRARPKAQWPAGEYDWHDFCTDTKTMEERFINLESDEFAGQSDLNDQIQSYKCGRDTAIKFCKNAVAVGEDDQCDEFMYGESGAGGSESQDIGVHDAHTTIRLTPYNHLIRHAATVYEQDHCHGHQSVVWINEGEFTSGDTYKNIHNTLATTPELDGQNPGIASVLLPQGIGYWMQVYEHPNFGGDSFYVDGSAPGWTRCKNFYQGFFNKYKNHYISSLKFGIDAVIQADDTPVDLGCCRLYQEQGYMETIAGAGVIFEDKCASWTGDAETHDVASGALTGVGSWRCAEDVFATFELMASTDNVISSMGATGGSFNVDAGLERDIMVTIEESAGSSIEVSATVYSEVGCAGTFDAVRSDGGDSGTGTYQNVKDDLATGQEIRSVFIQAGTGTELRFLPVGGTRMDFEKLVDSAVGGQTCFDLETAAGQVESLAIKAT